MQEELSLEEKATNDETWKHIHVIRRLISGAQLELSQRALEHDQSKLSAPEVDTFTEFTPKLKDSTYGSEEYQGFLKAMKPALDNHYAMNRHHPEWFKINKEEWRDVVGYEGLYRVSNLGILWSVKKDCHLKSYKTPKGYLRTQLFKDGKQKNFMVHRLVAIAFLENTENKPEVNHKNGIKSDNRLSNLEWCTPSENQIHAYDTGLKPPAVKYIVKCVELDFVTEGTEKMTEELKSRGYDRARSSGVWASINNDNRKHLDLTFEGYLIEEYGDVSYCDEMNILDLIEMIIDWKAASMRHDDGDINRSININAGRFNMSPQLVKILQNTVPELDKWLEQFTGTYRKNEE